MLIKFITLTLLVTLTVQGASSTRGPSISLNSASVGSKGQQSNNANSKQLPQGNQNSFVLGRPSGSFRIGLVQLDTQQNNGELNAALADQQGYTSFPFYLADNSFRGADKVLRANFAKLLKNAIVTDVRRKVDRSGTRLRINYNAQNELCEGTAVAQNNKSFQPESFRVSASPLAPPQAGPSEFILSILKTIESGSPQSSATLGAPLSGDAQNQAQVPNVQSSDENITVIIAQPAQAQSAQPAQAQSAQPAQAQSAQPAQAQSAQPAQPAQAQSAQPAQAQFTQITDFQNNQDFQNIDKYVRFVFPYQLTNTTIQNVQVQTQPAVTTYKIIYAGKSIAYDVNAFSRPLSQYPEVSAVTRK